LSGMLRVGKPSSLMAFAKWAILGCFCRGFVLLRGIFGNVNCSTWSTFRARRFVWVSLVLVYCIPKSDCA
jgi:hypothetical protein